MTREQRDEWIYRISVAILVALVIGSGFVIWE
jgi:hypothetical protein